MKFKVIGEIKYKDGTIEEVLEELTPEEEKVHEELQKFKIIEVKDEKEAE